MSCPPSEQTYAFSLDLYGDAEPTAGVADSLSAVGCDDATVSVCGGRLRLDFTRAARSLREAVETAIYDALRATGRDASALEPVAGGPTRAELDAMLADREGRGRAIRFGSTIKDMIEHGRY